MGPQKGRMKKRIYCDRENLVLRRMKAAFHNLHSGVEKHKRIG